MREGLHSGYTIYNYGGGPNVTLSNVVSLNATVREVVDSIKVFIPDLRIEFVDNRIMNQLSYEVLTTHLDEKNFVFQGDIRQGIKDTISLLKQAAPQKLTIQGIK